MAVVDSIQNPRYVVGVGYNAGEPQYLEWRVVGVNAHIDAECFAHGHDGREEIPHILTQSGAVDTLVKRQQATEQFYRIFIALLDVAVDKTLCLDDDGVDKFVFFSLGNGLVECVYLCQCFVGIIILGLRPFENVYVEIGKAHLVEVKRRRTVGTGVMQVGAYPVDYRHEVVADGCYAAPAQVGETGYVVFDEAVTLGTAILDGLAHGQTLDDRPSEAVRFDHVFYRFYFFDAPYFAVGHIVQGGNNSFHTDLSQHVERDGVFGPKPSPSLFHIECCI